MFKKQMPINTTQIVAMNIRFNRAVETFKHFTSGWDEFRRKMLSIAIKKDLAEAVSGNKLRAGEHLTEHLSMCFCNERSSLLGNEGEQNLDEAIHDFVPVAILCKPQHLKQINQFCEELSPSQNPQNTRKATQFEIGIDRYKQLTSLFPHSK